VPWPLALQSKRRSLSKTFCRTFRTLSISQRRQGSENLERLTSPECTLPSWAVFACPRAEAWRLSALSVAAVQAVKAGDLLLSIEAVRWNGAACRARQHHRRSPDQGRRPDNANDLLIAFG
ncbi:hypothetical protein, partial [Mesorhizobium sp. M0965]|uniref:hypothetical protein n=1 Tax=Mesorhizobium sp. M0965 TaxID=2957036 RepID=UPI00333ACA74